MAILAKRQRYTLIYAIYARIYAIYARIYAIYARIYAIYARGVTEHLKSIDAKYHRLIREKIEEQLLHEPAAARTGC